MGKAWELERRKKEGRGIIVFCLTTFCSSKRHLKSTKRVRNVTQCAEGSHKGVLGLSLCRVGRFRLRTTGRAWQGGEMGQLIAMFGILLSTERQQRSSCRMARFEAVLRPSCTVRDGFPQKWRRYRYWLPKERKSEKINFRNFSKNQRPQFHFQ